MSMSTSDLHNSSIDVESMGSTSINKQTVIRAWGWAVRNKWAERIQTKKGEVLRCRYPGCKMEYISKEKTTSGINKHLLKAHHITKDSNINDGSLSRHGPLDKLLHSSSQPRIFDPTRFDDLLVQFILKTKQPFTIVEGVALQELLNHATMASISQVKLPSGDTMATKVRFFLTILSMQYLFF